MVGNNEGLVSAYLQKLILRKETLSYPKNPFIIEVRYNQDIGLVVMDIKTVIPNVSNYVLLLCFGLLFFGFLKTSIVVFSFDVLLYFFFSATFPYLLIKNRLGSCIKRVSCSKALELIINLDGQFQ